MTEVCCVVLKPGSKQRVCCCAQAPFKRSHVAILNAAGRTVAHGLGMHVVDFEMMASQFDSASQYLAVMLTPWRALSLSSNCRQGRADACQCAAAADQVACA